MRSVAEDEKHTSYPRTPCSASIWACHCLFFTAAANLHAKQQYKLVMFVRYHAGHFRTCGPWAFGMTEQEVAVVSACLYVLEWTALYYGFFTMPFGIRSMVKGTPALAFGHLCVHASLHFLVRVWARCMHAAWRDLLVGFMQRRQSIGMSCVGDCNSKAMLTNRSDVHSVEQLCSSQQSLL